MAFGGGLSRKNSASSKIPTSSLADIAFLLLVFFMVTTVFQSDSEQPIVWPEAMASEKIDEKVKNILNIWVQRDGTIFINDRQYTIDQVSEVVGPLYSASDRALVISIRGDREVPYRTMDQIQKELVSAGVYRVVFAAELEERMSRTRR